MPGGPGRLGEENIDMAKRKRWLETADTEDRFINAPSLTKVFPVKRRCNEDLGDAAREGWPKHFLVS